jgi:hypothetical protein
VSLVVKISAEVISVLLLSVDCGERFDWSGEKHTSSGKLFDD